MSKNYTIPSTQTVGTFVFKRVDTCGNETSFNVMQVAGSFGYNRAAAWVQAVEESNRIGVHQTAALELVAEPKPFS